MCYKIHVMFGIARLQSTRNEQVPQRNLVHGSMILPVVSLGLCLVDEVVCVTVGLQLGVPLCEPRAHSTIVVNKRTCSPPMASAVPRARDAILSTSLANYKAQFPTPWNLLARHIRTDGRRPDGVTITPWDVTFPDTFSGSHEASATRASRAVAEEAEERKKQKYSDLALTHHVIPLAIETAEAFGPD